MKRKSSSSGTRDADIQDAAKKAAIKAHAPAPSLPGAGSSHAPVQPPEFLMSGPPTAPQASLDNSAAVSTPTAVLEQAPLESTSATMVEDAIARPAQQAGSATADREWYCILPETH